MSLLKILEMSIKIQDSKQRLFLCQISLNFIALEPTRCRHMINIRKVSCVHILPTKRWPFYVTREIDVPKRECVNFKRLIMSWEFLHQSNFFFFIKNHK